VVAERSLDTLTSLARSFRKASLWILRSWSSLKDGVLTVEASKDLKLIEEKVRKIAIMSGEDNYAMPSLGSLHPLHFSKCLGKGVSDCPNEPAAFQPGLNESG
jgi:hypothetical protein